MKIKKGILVSKILERVRIELSFWGTARNLILFPIKKFMHKLGLFRKGTNIKRLIQAKKIYKGERCFIIATGPSLTLEDIERVKNEYTFSVNGINRLFSQTSWRPNFYVLLDPFYYEKAYDQGDFQTEYYYKDLSFLNCINRKHISDHNAILLDVCYLDHVTHYNHEKKKWKYCEDIENGIYDCGSVVCSCIQLAMYLGFSEIYLLGVDNDYTGSKQHFTGGSVLENMNYDTAVKTQRMMDEGFAFVGNIAKKNGVKVYNATRGGKLDFFQRVKIEDVI